MKDVRGTDGRRHRHMRGASRLMYVRGMLPLGHLLSGERRAAGVTGVRFEPKVPGHVVVGLGQQGQQSLFGLSELFERHAQSGLEAERVRVVVVLVVHDGLRQFPFDVLVLQVFQFFRCQAARVQCRTAVLGGRGHCVPTAQRSQYRFDSL